LSITPGQPPAVHLRGEVHRIEGPARGVQEPDRVRHEDC
jgi:hypothetical protein